MSFLKSLGKIAGKGIKLISPLAGPLGGAVGGFVGDVLEGGNAASHLRSAAMGGVGGGVLGRVSGGAVKALGGSGVRGALGKIGGYAADHPDAILAAAGGLYGAKRASDAGKLQKQALQSAAGAYDQRAPLRALAIQRLTQAPAVNLGPLFDDPSNPFGRGRVRALG